MASLPGRAVPSGAVQGGSHWWQNVVVGGGWESDFSLADGFWEIAETTFTEIGQRPNDGKFVPAMYNVRHAFELALKEAVRGLALYLRREAEFGGRAVIPGLTRDAVERRMTKTHRLQVLLDEVQALLPQAGVDVLPPDVVDVVRALHDLDPSGQEFRYSKVKDKAMQLVPARPNQELVDVIALRDRLRAAFKLIAWGLVGGELDNWLDLQADFHAEARSWGP
jgi:hypothetical protein